MAQPKQAIIVEAQLQVALQAVLCSGLNSRGDPHLSLRSAAKQFAVSRSALTARWNGRETRAEAHEKQQRLSNAAEQELVAWVKVMGRRGVPLSPEVCAEYASTILDQAVGTGWVRRFRGRHPDIKGRWTTGLESCRASALNKTFVTEFFDILQELVTEFSILPRDIYNMDEKGIQLGIGLRSLALVDRNQKTVYKIEDGNRELVTVIECISADGVALPPSVIYKAKRRDLIWATVNPCEASISFSPNGWTDQELGSKWLIKDFEPHSRARMDDPGWRLLILDGHNSHCTYSFMRHCELNQILVICLPSHTTHRLQPCDVGVFGPLASSWKKEVSGAAHSLIKISKYNILGYYHPARTRAFKKSTIQSAFRTTGIWPINSSVIEDSAFTPALNTSTQAAQPVPATLSTLLTPEELPSASTSAATDPISTVIHPAATLTADDFATPHTPVYSSYRLVGLPALLPNNATRDAYQRQCHELRAYCARAKTQMEADHVSKKLMDAENQRLRTKLFEKTAKPKRMEGGSRARHMTSSESMIALANGDWRKRMEPVLKEMSESRRARDAFRKKRAEEIKNTVIKKIKDLQKAALKQMQDTEKAAAAVEKELMRQEKAAEKALEAERKQRDKLAAQQKRDADAERKAAEKEKKAAQKAADRAQKDAEKAQKDAEKAQKDAEKVQKNAERRVAASRTKRKAAEITAPEPEQNVGPSSSAKRPKPRPLRSELVLVPLATAGPADELAAGPSRDNLEREEVGLENEPSLPNPDALIDPALL